MLEKLIAREHVDFTVVNIENAAGGFGDGGLLGPVKLPIDVFTSGNHIWDKKDFVPLLDDLEKSCARELSAGQPGAGGRSDDGGDIGRRQPPGAGLHGEHGPGSASANGARDVRPGPDLKSS